MKKQLVPVVSIEHRILFVRGQRVILDSDLAAIYGVTTKALNQAVRRNIDRFPVDFAFLLAPQEVTNMRSQIVTASKRNIRYRPYVFTEHGAIMLATILNSPHAVKMSVFVVRAFIKMRSMILAQDQLVRKLAELEKKLTSRLDMHEHTLSDIIQQIMQLLNPPAEPEAPPLKLKEIGFHVREPHAPYGIKKQRERK